MTTIREEDFVASVADAFQFISCYHPKDYIDHLWEAYQKEQSPAAKDAMAQILVNSRMAAEGRRPMCQDTGIAIAFIPLPIHLPAGLIAAMIWHLNVPTLVVTSTFVNPLTAVPVYYFAYRVGTLLLGQPAGSFGFEFSMRWLQDGLGITWKPFLLGCLVCAVVGGYGSYRLLELAWRISTMNRKSARRTAASMFT